jgi:hypothetical protein
MSAKAMHYSDVSESIQNSDVMTLSLPDDNVLQYIGAFIAHNLD